MPLIAESDNRSSSGKNEPIEPNHTYRVFYSNVVDGKMWCPHCVRVEFTLKSTFDGDDKPKAIVHWVGDRPEWYDPQNEARVHWKVDKVPTILRLESGKETARLKADGILDEECSSRYEQFDMMYERVAAINPDKVNDVPENHQSNKMPLIATPYPHVMNGLNGPTAPKYTYLVFYSSVVNGKMWCPDCVRVESTVKAAFDSEDKPKAIIHWVGDRPEWRDPKNEARVHWNVSSVPTILRLEAGKETARLVEDEILDKKKLEDFVKSE